mmetsp:Transcript_37693/g.81725  ORF Transcript_37693/g.81725 Transcript_37693/m.81725 type:complete len:206 (+) Transcript_37693:224-841(+)
MRFRHGLILDSGADRTRQRRRHVVHRHMRSNENVALACVRCRVLQDGCGGVCDVLHGDHGHGHIGLHHAKEDTFRLHRSGLPQKVLVEQHGEEKSAAVEGASLLQLTENVAEFGIWFQAVQTQLHHGVRAGRKGRLHCVAHKACTVFRWRGDNEHRGRARDSVGKSRWLAHVRTDNLDALQGGDALSCLPIRRPTPSAGPDTGPG